MFKEIKLPFNISLMEALTLLFFVVLGYLFIYRFSYYNSLGVNWFITSISPSQIITSSFKILFSVLVGWSIYFLIFQFSNLFKRNILVINILIAIIGFIWIILVFFPEFIFIKKYIKFIEQKNISYIFAIHYTLLIFFFRKMFDLNKSITNMSNRINKENSSLNYFDKSLKERLRKIKNMITINYSTLFLITVLTPFSNGIRDASLIMKNKDKNLNSVILANDKNKWLLLEISGDKVLLLQKNKYKYVNVFKLVEYKEIKTILSPIEQKNMIKILNSPNKP
ncbi:hypothetical protein NCZ17_00790 [Acinetobacter modestus]|uniref:hypothetical protein n=1 Tax=Acinetobacter modestus TaxID=1776740 RepID=UPI0020301553|nr:hypothetical protein [Acinetobacter modestus]MCM1957907.1 hypothetical protein [Acinetobacter modestus]